MNNFERLLEKFYGDDFDYIDDMMGTFLKKAGWTSNDDMVSIEKNNMFVSGILINGLMTVRSNATPSGKRKDISRFQATGNALKDAKNRL